MKYKNHDLDLDLKLDELIRTSMNTTDEPSLELNNSLKASLYHHESVLRRQAPARTFSLWYLPMILNFVTFILLAAAALLVIANPLLSKFIAGVCFYFSFAGIFITILGIKRTALKEELTIRIQKRGVTA